MTVVNFSVPPTLEKRVKEVIKQKGFASKAEFFRLAAIYFIDVVDKPFVNEDERFGFLAGALKKRIRQLYRGEKLPSAKDQLANL